MSPGPVSSDLSVLSVATPRTARTISSKSTLSYGICPHGHVNHIQAIRVLVMAITNKTIAFKTDIMYMEWRTAKRYFVGQSLPGCNYKVKRGFSSQILMHGNILGFTVSFGYGDAGESCKARKRLPACTCDCLWSTVAICRRCSNAIYPLHISPGDPV